MSDPGTAASAYAQFPITTESEFPEWGIERSVGLVFGVMVFSSGTFSAAKLTAGMTTKAGTGELAQLSRIREEARSQSVGRLIENARLLGANGVVGFRFESSSVGTTVAELVAYGTGVVLGPKR